MRPFLRILCAILFCFSLAESKAQCPTGYTANTLNWDLMTFLVEGGTVTNAMATSQKFAFGKNQLNISHNYITANTAGDNITHTGFTSSFGDGADVQFKGNGTITLTFAEAVQNVKFSLYDIDYLQRVTITSANGATPQPITTLAGIGSTLVSIVGSGSATASATANNTYVDNTSTAATVNVSITGPVTSVTITVSNSATATVTTSSGNGNGNGNTTTTIMEDGIFWLSDIGACSVTQSFPSNYYQTGSNQPFIGQPDYFITTPDNNSAYMVDPATGRAWLLFTEAGATYINSFAYDPFRKFLYYVTDGSSNASNNKRIRKYDFNTETSSDFITNVNNYGIPTFTQGVESAAACYYDGALYFGVEGGTSSESIVWRIDIDNSGVPASKAYQVLGMPSTGHDWGDFAIKNGILYDFNTAREGTSPSFTYTNSAYHHYNMITGGMTNYTNPNANNAYVGQAAIDWAGNLYSIRNSVQRYNENGTLQNAIPITVVRGAAWVGNAGDASEPFKPKADFGDATASYDPDPRSPAVHEWDPNLRLGATFDREWDKKVSLNSDGDTGDDGLPFARILNLSGGNYQTDLNVFNNTGAPATVAAWIDFNANGTFESSEGIELVVPSNPSMQQVSLYWPSIGASLPANSYTVLRIRVTSSANGMTKSQPTGYYANGEVEDYRIIVNATTLATNNLEFNVVKEKEVIKLQWKGPEGSYVNKYIVERSSDGFAWTAVDAIRSNHTFSYIVYDKNPLSGKNYYRLRLEMVDGKHSYSEARIIQFNLTKSSVQILGNPAKNTVTIAINAIESGIAELSVIDMNGQKIIGRQVLVQKGNGQHIIAVSQLPSGRYILYFRQNLFADQKPFVITK